MDRCIYFSLDFGLRKLGVVVRLVTLKHPQYLKPFSVSCSLPEKVVKTKLEERGLVLCTISKPFQTQLFLSSFC